MHGNQDKHSFLDDPVCNIKQITETEEETSPYIWPGAEEEEDFYFVCGFGDPNHCDEFKLKLKVSVKQDCTTADTKPGMKYKLIVYYHFSNIRL